MFCKDFEPIKNPFKRLARKLFWPKKLDLRNGPIITKHNRLMSFLIKLGND